MGIFVGNKNIIAVDFDGTITKTVGLVYQPDYKLVLREYCKETLLQLHKDGVGLILWTCRTGKALEEAILFLKEEGIFEVFSAVNDHHPRIKEEWAGHDIARKLYADVYIDDHNLTGDTNWYIIEGILYTEWGTEDEPTD